MIRYSLMIAAIALLLLSCKKFELPDGLPPRQDIVVEPPTAGDSTLKDMPFYWGAALNVGILKSNSNYGNLARQELRSITPENAMKIRVLQPERDVFDWEDADYLVNFAQENNLRVHGHTLVWHNSLPQWLSTFDGDSAELEAIMKNHIETVVSRYKGAVTSWDVVNEAFNDDGTYRNSIWYNKLGADFIARAFQYTHDIDPDAILFYNDYGHEYSSSKRTAITNLLSNLKSRGIPVHGIGMQMHTRYNQSKTNLLSAITMAIATGLKVHISELDIAVNPDNIPTLTYSPTLQEEQALQFEYIVSTYYNTVPEDQQFGITTWNLTDADSWIPVTYSRPDWPLLFDGSYERKLPYYYVLRAVR